MFKSYDPKELKTSQLHEYLLGTIAPRPIAWASTIDKEGNVNLSPFSFFNVFGSNPPVIIFSPSRRVRDNTTKHTLQNIKDTGECVINIVDYNTVGQMVLTSGDFDEDVNEFEMANLHSAPSVKVKPPRVADSPAQFECKVRDIIALGEHGGAGNLIVCDIIYVHLSEHIFGEDGKVDPRKVDNIARLGNIWYTRASAGLFELPTPKGKTMIGYTRLPDEVRNSRFFTETEKAKLASIEYVPSNEDIDLVKQSPGMAENYEKYGDNPEEFQSKVFAMAKSLIEENKIEEAWKVIATCVKLN